MIRESLDQTNLVGWRAWGKQFGEPMDKDATLAILRELGRVAQTGYAGPESVAELFRIFELADSVSPTWDLVFDILWLLNPEEFFPIKISIFRATARALKFPVKKKSPNPDEFEVIMRFVQTIREALSHWKPTSVLDVQSFIWVAGVWIKQNKKNTKRRIWLIAPGENAAEWDNFQSGGIAAIGWKELGDLSQFDAQKDIQKALQNSKSFPDGDHRHAAKTCWDFANRIEVGDWVVAKKGRTMLLGAGEVTDEYEYHEEANGLPNIVQVSWWEGLEPLEVGKPVLPIKTLTDVSSDNRILKWLETKKENQTPPSQPIDQVEETEFGLAPYTKEDFLKDAFLDDEDYANLVSLLKRKKALILQGPPGVGKSFLAQRLAYAMIGQKDPSKVGTVQFHQSYSYEDFIQGYRPMGDDGTMYFALRNGVFYDFCERARKNENLHHFFIIDEINRGNLSRIFGEVMLLLEADKRSSDFGVSLTYSPSSKFHIPPNLYLIGLMNTADRSLAMVDYALRRRFAFASLQPQFESPKFHQHLAVHGINGKFSQRLAMKMKELNSLIASDTRDLGHGFCIGHSYFTPTDCISDPDAWFREIVNCEIKPLLEEYWADNITKANFEITKLLDG